MEGDFGSIFFDETCPFPTSHDIFKCYTRNEELVVTQKED